ncbi:hypothetical protein M9194_20110 [Vibrio sp. S4M6]|uniref:hypothetical protein n=1 Tax=Vibrio sinus TaxID=2946865 RepID=UPI00202AAA6B|nr:hypothetical protein [Vibrio sinus]MCL9783733.1 hypothetical protein [Vibrio sinus]
MSNMDLKTQRNLDRFMELIGVFGVRADDCIELIRDNERLFIEQKSEHVLFSVGLAIEATRIQKAQLWAMERLNIERTFGLLVRCFRLGDILVCSVSIPHAVFSGDALYPLYQYLSRLLTRASRGVW